MGVLAAAGVAALVLVLTVAVRWFAPASVASMAREFGVSSAAGWAAYLLWLAGLVAPVALGAPFEGDSLPVAGGLAAYTLGAYLLVLALSSQDERRALATGEELDPEQVGSAATGREPTPVVTSGTPTVEEPVRTLAGGTPAVYAEWTVQDRRSTLNRTNWHVVAAGSRTAPFGVDSEGLRVEPGGRTFGTETAMTSYEPDEPLPGTAATLFNRHEDFPAAAEREKRVRIIEEFVPADSPVTVAGVPHVEAGTVVLDRGPPDGLLGSGDGEPAPVLVSGTVPEARRQLRKRVVWLGLAGAALVVAGQAVVFAFTPAALPLP